MTTPEENRPKTDTTDEVLTEKNASEAGTPDAGATGRTVKEALEEAGVSPEDFEEK
ncbi:MULTISPECIES: hypothetical protein [unclassified Streptomyces]|uniref:hypothetical protein n=1 Tax=unclassified Streptomyces TaxID=2593676 RepID=UPI0024B71CEE|nr:hypothetical protein [Streptomyces sp. KAU_LT]MDI9830317.1 hypothetical protein [Streptomyces sp. KAU_LT]